MLTCGLDLGGTKVLGLVAGDDGVAVAERRVPTPRGADRVLDTLVGLLDELAAEAGGVAALGVGFAGLVDRDGTVRSAPNVGGVDGLPLRARLRAATGLPVAVDNDANAAAWGEVTHGAARGADDALVITLGTGVGGGLVTGGRVYRGAAGLAAEIGHFVVDPDGPRCACGGIGHWEALASGVALGRLGREAARQGRSEALLALADGDPQAVTGRLVGDAARAGDPGALEVLESYARWVALGLGGLANILDPAVIVVGGGLIELGELLLAPVRAAFPAHLEAPDRRPPIPIVAAALGERAGAVGAAALARDLVPASA